MTKIPLLFPQQERKKKIHTLFSNEKSRRKDKGIYRAEPHHSSRHTCTCKSTSSAESQTCTGGAHHITQYHIIPIALEVPKGKEPFNYLAIDSVTFTVQPHGFLSRKPHTSPATSLNKHPSEGIHKRGRDAFTPRPKPPQQIKHFLGRRLRFGCCHAMPAEGPFCPH
jgi:hypothetical protein